MAEPVYNRVYIVNDHLIRAFLLGVNLQVSCASLGMLRNMPNLLWPPRATAAQARQLQRSRAEIASNLKHKGKDYEEDEHCPCYYGTPFEFPQYMCV